jgi:hypothetical protein
MGRFELLRDPEVEQLHRPVGAHEHVGRLDVAMDHEVLVRVQHRLADGAHQLQSLAERGEWFSRQ